MNNYRTKSLKSLITDKNFLTVLVTILFTLAIIAAIIAVFAFYRKNVQDRPVILGMSLEEKILTVNGGKREDILYCITKEKKPNSCEWQNYNTFPLTEEMTYYIFIKNETNNKISKPETFKYKEIDYQEMRM